MSQVSIEKIQNEAFKIIEETLSILDSQMKSINSKEKLLKIKYESKNLKYTLVELETFLREFFNSLKNQEKEYQKNILDLENRHLMEEDNIQKLEVVLDGFYSKIKKYEREVKFDIIKSIDIHLKPFREELEKIFFNRTSKSKKIFWELRHIKNFDDEQLKIDFSTFLDKGKIKIYQKEKTEKLLKWLSEVLNMNLSLEINKIEKNINKNISLLASRINEKYQQEIKGIFYTLNHDVSKELEIYFPLFKVELENPLTLKKYLSKTDTRDIAYTISIVGISITEKKAITTQIFQLSSEEIHSDIDIKLNICIRQFKKQFEKVYIDKISKIINKEMNFVELEFNRYKENKVQRVKYVKTEEIPKINETIASSKILQKRNKKLIQRVQVAQKLLSDMGEKNV